MKTNWANDKMGYGNIVFLETGMGKTYIAIMLLRYLFSEKFVDYRMRLIQNPMDMSKDSAYRQGVHLKPIELEEETDDKLRLEPYSDE